MYFRHSPLYNAPVRLYHIVHVFVMAIILIHRLHGVINSGHILVDLALLQRGQFLEECTLSFRIARYFKVLVCRLSRGL
jgi:hypothetical protein